VGFYHSLPPKTGTPAARRGYISTGLDDFLGHLVPGTASRDDFVPRGHLARNLLNIFVSPIRVSEFVAATYIVGFVKILVTVAILAGLASWFYHWNLFQMGLR